MRVAVGWGLGFRSSCGQSSVRMATRQTSLGSKTTIPNCQVLLPLGHTWEEPAHAGVGLMVASGI